MSAVDSEEIRKAMRQWVTGVTVVTAVYEGYRHGMTVNSFTSISLSPPLILVSLERQTRTHHMVEQSGNFGVTILDHNQLEISDCFAGRHTEVEDRFENVETYSLVSGVSLIAGGLAAFDCRVVSKFEAGTHTLFIGEVMAQQIDSAPEGQIPDLSGEMEEKSSVNGNHDPLVYYNRAYRRLQK